MKLFACLTRFPREWETLTGILEELPGSVLISDRAAALLHEAEGLDPDLFLIDARMAEVEMEALLDQLPTGATALAVRPPIRDGMAPRIYDLQDHPRVYDSFALNDPPRQQGKVIQRALERAGMKLPPSHLPAPVEAEPEQSLDRPTGRSWELALHFLSRTLSAGFDPDELIRRFLDLSVEVAGVARAAVLVPDPVRTVFRVGASRGLLSTALQSYSHPRDSGLVRWLRTEGRPLRRDDPTLRRHKEAQDLARSFTALQAEVCIPVGTLGDLQAILALGSRISGGPPTSEQVEAIFTIASNVAVSLENIRLHQEVAHQKAQMESVLEHMTSGVAAIDYTGRVALFNRRAAEILQVSPEAVLGQDLRELPAPLGDLLYGALRSGEVERYPLLDLPAGGIPVEASTYPLFLPGDLRPVGSVLVVEDLTERLALEESKRHADRQELFNRLVGQIAHEIKNPLVAVKTFADLFDSGFTDPEFNGFVRKTVLPEITRLDDIVGKLVDFVNQGVAEVEDSRVAPLVQEVVQRATIDGEGSQARLVMEVDEDLPPVRADAAMLSKALGYLVNHLLLAVPADGDGAEVRISATRSDLDADTVWVDLSSDRPWLKEGELESVFDPLYVREDQLNLGLPAARKIIQENRGNLEVLAKPDHSGILRVSLQAAR